MTNPTPHGQVPEVLIDLIDAYAEARHRCGGIYNAKTEAARKAVIEALSGVQALSAAPSSPWSRALEIRMAQGWKLKGDRLPVLYTDTINGEGVGRDDLWLCTTKALAASPTPPALSAAPARPTVEQVEDEVSMGHGAWDMVDPQELIGAVLRLAASPTPPAEQQAAPKAAPGEPDYSEKWDAELGRTAMRFVDRAGDVHPGIDDAETICAEFHNAMSEVIDRMPHVRRMAAPQQEAQEPVAYVHVPHYTVEGKVRPVVSFEKYQQDYADGIYSTRIPLYTAHQSAPAPLSDDAERNAAFEVVRKKLCALPRFSFLSDGYGAVRRVPDKSGSWIAFDAAHAMFDPVAVDAALAAQKGTP